MAAGDWKDMLSAIHAGNINLVRYHIEAGVNPNYQHPEFLTTPLIESIIVGEYEITVYLLSVGADPTLKAGFSEDSPLSVAKQQGDPRMIQLVKSYLPEEKGLLQRLKERWLG